MLTVLRYHREAFQQVFRGILYTLLQRMHTSKTDQFVYYFVYYLSFCLALKSESLTPDFFITEAEGIQQG